MKRFFIVVLLISLISFVSCKKEYGGLQLGTYCGSTVDGMVNIELLTDDHCVLYITGGPEKSGYWRVREDGSIYLSGTIYTSERITSSNYHLLSFSAYDQGKILSNTSFIVHYERDYDKGQHPLTLTRRK